MICIKYGLLSTIYLFTFCDFYSERDTTCKNCIKSLIASEKRKFINVLLYIFFFILRNNIIFRAKLHRRSHFHFPPDEVDTYFSIKIDKSLCGKTESA